MRRPQQIPGRLTVVLACLLLGIPGCASAQVQLSPVDNDHVSILINGQPFSDFYIQSSYTKPFLAPLRSATGLIVTRRFPMERVEGESRDHPHHKGLWIGYGDVNGLNFWETEPESNASGSNPKEKGKIRLKKLNEVKSGKKSGSIDASFAWLSAEGEQILEENRTMVFYADNKIRRFDVDATLTARVSVHFADTKEGFFAIRVADSMSGKNGGVLTNSEGSQTEKDVWGKRADWVDYVGPVAGQKIGILILDHPQNPNHPPRWHARDYGLFAVNPFGVRDFDPTSQVKGGYTIGSGNSARFRYRVIIHSGDVPKKDIARWYSDYAKSTR
ncbi:MAG: PmoA family protein [Acidobacteriota bacterium]|nr:PmoA family protein [Acidobacteriota bacterium]